MGANVRSNFWLAHMVAPGMAARGGGAIIIVSSIAGLRGSANLGIYALSKAADMQLARNLALEWGASNIRTNCIAPGLVRTDFARALWKTRSSTASAPAKPRSNASANQTKSPAPPSSSPRPPAASPPVRPSSSTAAPPPGASPRKTTMAERIRVTASISLDPDELEETFIRASGPGGQNVNKVSTAVQLRFDVRRSPALPDAVRARLERLCGSRLTNDGVLVLTAQRHRSQDRNRADALATVVELIRTAAIAPVKRRPTRPTLASRERRLEAKTRRAGIKRGRGGAEHE